MLLCFCDVFQIAHHLYGLPAHLPGQSADGCCLAELPPVLRFFYRFLAFIYQMELKNAADSYVQLGHLTRLSAVGVTTIPVAMGV